MASLGFVDMTRRNPFYHLLKATQARERPSVENNYFTTEFSNHLSHKQPLTLEDVMEGDS